MLEPQALVGRRCSIRMPMAGSAFANAALRQGHTTHDPVDRDTATISGHPTPPMIKLATSSSPSCELIIM